MVWIFGYGSLIWRPDFPHVRAEPAYILGWERRFWQGSTDHRGMPGAPGRVVTLIAREGARCFGRAFQLAPSDEAEVLRKLDVREQGGYAQHQLPLYLPDGRVLAPDGLVYLATPENPNWLGEDTLEKIADTVRGSRGPSGANLEYVLELARALREMGADDDHVFSVAGLLSSSES